MSITSTTAPEDILKGGSLVALDIRVWGGAAAISREQDLPQVAGALPPKELVADGDKYLVDPRVLRGLEALRQRAAAVLKGIGAPLLGGRFIPDAKVDETLAALATIETDFSVAVDNIASDLPRHYAEWEAKHPAWAGLLRSARITPDQFRARCRFGAVVCKVASPHGAAAAGLAAAASSFDEDVCEEARTEAARILKDSFTGRTSPAGQRALRPIKALGEKLAGLRFVGPRVGAMADAIAVLLASLPTQGNLADNEVAQVVQALEQIRTGSVPIPSATLGVLPMPASAPQAEPEEPEPAREDAHQPPPIEQETPVFQPTILF